MKTKEKGITLIALIITVIILLILAGTAISISVNGGDLFKKTTQAREEWNTAVKQEETSIKSVLSYIDSSIFDENNSLPENKGTKPYLPSATYSMVKNTDLIDGLVITDQVDSNGNSIGNEYVWIEVPSTYLDNTITNGPDYSSVSGPQDYLHIEEALRNYCAKDSNNQDLIRISSGFIDGTDGCVDEWYDKLGVSYDGINDYAEVKRINSANAFNKANEYYGTLYTDQGVTAANEYVANTKYYAKIKDKINDTSGCGLTYSDYNSKKHVMLESIYKNGGFWIGRYEAGLSFVITETNGTKDQLSTYVPLSKKGLAPIMYVTCGEAQMLANNVNSGTYTSSLMFGIQYDLVLKHLNNKGVSAELLISDSKPWGNFYSKEEFTITEGGYYDIMISWPPEFTQVEGSYTLENNHSICLTTGATARNMKKNIYDLAGNLSEYTLEKSSYLWGPSGSRSSSWGTSGTVTASTRNHVETNYTDMYNGFRVCIY